MQRTLSYLIVSLALLWCLPAQAQLRNGSFRFSLDTDIVSFAGVHTDHSGDAMLFGFGPNQLGAQHALQVPMSPVGLGFGWAVSHKILLGLRTGLGYDVIAPDGADDKMRVLVVSLQPGITFVPVGNRAKLFINLSPIFQVNRVAIDNAVGRYLFGGFGAGIGALIFAGSSASIDLGFHFEGRFGNERLKDDENEDTTDHYRILQGVVRLGVSLWK